MPHPSCPSVEDVLKVLYSRRHGRSDKRAEEKRQLKIIRLKKEKPPKDILNLWNKDFDNRWPTAWSKINDQKRKNHNSPKANRKIIFPGFSRQNELRKKALKLIRLKKSFEPPDTDQDEFSSKWFSVHNHPEKRALKVIRLKKSRNGENIPTPNDVSHLNPAAQFRIGRGDPNPYFRTLRTAYFWKNFGRSSSSDENCLQRPSKFGVSGTDKRYHPIYRDARTFRILLTPDEFPKTQNNEGRNDLDETLPEENFNGASLAAQDDDDAATSKITGCSKVTQMSSCNSSRLKKALKVIRLKRKNLFEYGTRDLETPSSSKLQPSNEPLSPVGNSANWALVN